MGTPMAAHLVKAGFDVTVYDIRPETVEIFVGAARRQGREIAAGSRRRAPTPSSRCFPTTRWCARWCSATARAAWRRCCAKGAIVIDMSTSRPGRHALARGGAEAARHRRRRCAGDGRRRVREGRVARHHGRRRPGARSSAAVPLLEAMGRNIIDCGAVGNAHALKALANYVNACALINSIEALTIGKRFGLDAEADGRGAHDRCAPGATTRSQKKIVPHVFTRKYGTGMAMGFIAKDVKIALDTAQPSARSRRSPSTSRSCGRPRRRSSARSATRRRSRATGKKLPAFACSFLNLPPSAARTSERNENHPLRLFMGRNAWLPRET